MSLIYYKLSAAIIIFLASIIVVIYPLYKKSHPSFSESAELGDALASGIFFGAALFHMLPDAINSFNLIYPHATYPIAEAVCTAGFLLLLFLERFSISHVTLSSKQFIPYMLLFMLTIHALIEGAALGVGITFSETILLFIAIIAHKGTETFAVSNMLLRHNIALRQIILIIIFFSFVTPLGILLGTSIETFAAHQGQLIEAIVNAFAAGTFLYISTLHHIHFHKHAKDAQGMAEFACLFIGVLAMAVTAVWT